MFEQEGAFENKQIAVLLNTEQRHDEILLKLVRRRLLLDDRTEGLLRFTHGFHRFVDFRAGFQRVRAAC
jgi:hypothetical protein